MIKNKKREPERAAVNVVCGFPLAVVHKMADHLDKRSAQERDMFSLCLRSPGKQRPPEIDQTTLEMLFLQDMMRQDAGLGWGIIRQNLRELADDLELMGLSEEDMVFSWFFHEGHVFLTYVLHDFESDMGIMVFTFRLRKSGLAEKLCRLPMDEAVFYLLEKMTDVMNTNHPFRFIITKSDLLAVENGEWNPVEEEEIYVEGAGDE